MSEAEEYEIISAENETEAENEFGTVNIDYIREHYPKYAAVKAQLALYAKKQNAFIAAESDENKRRQMLEIGSRLYAEKEKDLKQAVEDNIRDAVREVSETKGLVYVCDESKVYFGGINITQEVMEILIK